MERYLRTILFVSILATLAISAVSPANVIGAPEPSATGIWALYGLDAPLGPKVTAQAVCLIETKTQTVLFEKNAYQPRAPASITKIATAMMVLKKTRLQDIVEIPAGASGIEGSTAGLRRHQKYTVEDLLKAMLIISGNDAATALAIHVGGDEKTFMNMLNEYMWDLGLLNTRFLNPHGISKPGHFSTAYDLALLGRWALDDDRFAQIVGTKVSRVHELTEDKETILSNTNKLLWTYPGAEGGKTGTTQVAGNCLLAAAKRGEMRLIAVVLGSRDRWGETSRLLDWGFENFRLQREGFAGQVWHTAKVTGGDAPTVDLACDSDVDAVIPRGVETALDVSVFEPVKAPIFSGQPLGVLRLRHRDTILKEASLVATVPVQKKTLIRSLIRGLSKMVTALLRL